MGDVESSYHDSDGSLYTSDCSSPGTSADGAVSGLDSESDISISDSLTDTDTSGTLFGGSSSDRDSAVYEGEYEVVEGSDVDIMMSHDSSRDIVAISSDSDSDDDDVIEVLSGLQPLPNLDSDLVSRVLSPDHYHPGQPGNILQINPGTSQANPGTSHANPGTSQANPGSSQANPGLSQANPGTLQANPGPSQVNPGTLQANPGSSQANPGTLQANPGTLQVNPGTLQFNSGTSQVNPGTLQVNPGTSWANPGTLQANPGTSLANPGLSQVNPGTLQTNPGLLQANLETLEANPWPSQANRGLFQANPGTSWSNPSVSHHSRTMHMMQGSRQGNPSQAPVGLSPSQPLPIHIIPTSSQSGGVPVVQIGYDQSGALAVLGTTQTTSAPQDFSLLNSSMADFESPRIARVAAMSVPAAQPSTSSPAGQPLTSDPAGLLDDDDNEEEECCPICFDPWTNSGTHRLVSLKCGHLFGQSCIERWLRGTGNDKCPKCNVKAKRKEIRILYAKSLKVVDTTERDDALNQLERERELRRVADRERADAMLALELSRNEVKRLQEEATRDRQRQEHQSVSSVSSSQPSNGSRFTLDKHLKISEAGDCRVMAYSPSLMSLCVSQSSPNVLFKGFGVKKVSVGDYRAHQYISLHSKMIRDMTFSPQESLLLSVSMDKTVKMTSLTSNTTVQTYNLPTPAWSCTWNKDDTRYFYTGLQNGTVHLYDVRNTAEHVTTINTSGSRSPAVSLKFIRRNLRSIFSGCGLLVGQLDRTCLYEKTVDDHKLHILPLEDEALVALIGAGGLALWAIQIIKAIYSTKVKVAAVDITAEKLEDAEAAGADIVHKWGTTEPSQEAADGLIRACQGRPDAIIDYIGLASVIERAHLALNIGGTLTLVGLTGTSLPEMTLNSVIRRNVTIRGIIVGNQPQCRELLQLVKDGKVSPPTSTYIELDELSNTLDKLQKGQQRGRAVIKM